MGKRKKAYVSVTNDLSTDNRVKKVCSFLHKNNYTVVLIGRKLKDSSEIKRAYKTKRFRLIFNNGPLFYAEYNFRLFCFLLFKKVHLLVSNDLDTLLANYAVSKFKPNVKLVYDSHEYFTESAELVNRNKIKNFWKGIETWIFPKLKHVYTVNETIAKEYTKMYKVAVNVVRNIPPSWKCTQVPSKAELNIPEQKFILIIQGAGININRGAEEAILAMKNLDNHCLLIVGSGDVLPKLKEMTIEENLTEKVLFFDKMPYEKMMHYTYHADIGLALDKPICLNYKYALPNKVFDYIHTSTPIVSTKLDEIEKLINKHEIGRVIEDFSSSSLNKTIKELSSNKELLEKMKENCKTAAKKENWENEVSNLHEIYFQ